MDFAHVNGYQLAYETLGPPDGEPLLLLMGTGAPLVFWDDDFCGALAVRNFRVILFDHRDVGRSTRLQEPMPDSVLELVTALQTGGLVPAYALDDLAQEAWCLLDALGVGTAHIAGISQGGGVAQLMAASAPARVRSLTSIAATSANPGLPPPSPETMATLMDVKRSRSLEEFIAWQIPMYLQTGSTTHPPPRQWLEERARRTWDHGYHFDGFLRHLLAVVTAHDRRPDLHKIAAPTLIVHGDADPIIPVAAAHDIAANLPTARLLVVPGMGHDLAPPYLETVASAMAQNLRRGVTSTDVGSTFGSADVEL